MLHNLHMSWWNKSPYSSLAALKFGGTSPDGNAENEFLMTFGSLNLYNSTQDIILKDHYSALSYFQENRLHP